MLEQPFSHTRPMKQMATRQPRHLIIQIMIPKTNTTRLIILILQILRRDANRRQTIDRILARGRTHIPRHHPDIIIAPQPHPLVRLAQQTLEDALDGHQVDLELFQHRRIGRIGTIPPRNPPPRPRPRRYIQYSQRIPPVRIGGAATGGMAPLGIVEFEHELASVGGEVERVVAGAARGDGVGGVVGAFAAAEVVDAQHVFGGGGGGGAAGGAVGGVAGDHSVGAC